MVRNAKLKIILFERHISQVQLAEMTRIPRSYISQAITGRLNLTGDEKWRIAAALDLDTEAIFPKEQD